MSKLDPNEPEEVAAAFNIAPCLAQEVVYENDEWSDKGPEDRWKRMRAWTARQIKQDSVKEPSK